MLMLPVPGGTVKVTLFPVACDPSAIAESVGARTGVTWVGSQAEVGAMVGPEIVPFGPAPSATLGEPGGVHAGEAVVERHAPFTHAESCDPRAPHSFPCGHEGKQNDPVEVLTQVAPTGQVFESLALQAAVHAPPGNSGFGSVAQISPAAHPAPHGFPRSALGPRFWEGQFAAGTQAPRPGQQE
jgi:hypothetical protein